jgi:hypothetical protein
VSENEQYRDDLSRARIIADPRKFRDYVLVPGHPKGKYRIFLGTLGFRPNSSADAWALARLYEEQAREQISTGDVQIGVKDVHGLRCMIVITVRGVALRMGWRLRDDGILWLSTPFSGFARALPKGK